MLSQMISLTGNSFPTLIMKNELTRVKMQRLTMKIFENQFGTALDSLPLVQQELLVLHLPRRHILLRLILSCRHHLLRTILLLCRHHLPTTRKPVIRLLSQQSVVKEIARENRHLVVQPVLPASQAVVKKRNLTPLPNCGLCADV